MKYKEYKKDSILFEDIQNPNKPLIFANNIVQGLGLLMFSYKTKTNQLESIVPVLTKNHTTLQKAITVNNQKMIWWYKAWNTLINSAKKENKLDDLKNEIETNLNTLKFKKGIWVIPHSAHPIVKQFFIKLKQDLKSNFKFILTDKETGDSNIPQLNFALVIKKSIPLKIILQTLGSDQLEKHYKNVFKKDFDKSSGSIIDQILNKSSSDKSALDNIASYFGEENHLEKLIITLFESQNIFSSSILSQKEDTEIPISHEDSGESGELQDSTSTSEEIKPTEQEKNLNSEKNPDTNQEVIDAKIEENQKSAWQHRKENIEKERLKNQQVNENENNKKSEFSVDKFIEVGYVNADEFEEKNKFIIEETLTKLIENTNDENKETELNEYKKIIRDYTNITNVMFNSFLRAYDVEKLLKSKVKGLADIDLFSKKTPNYDLSNEKYLLDYKLITDVFSAKDFNQIDSALKAIDILVSNIETFYNIFSATDGFDHQLTVFRGVPATLRIRGNDEVITDKWLRNPEHPLSSDSTGEFKRLLIEELNAGGNYDEIISKFYKINSSIETKSFLSTSISLYTASDFSVAYTIGSTTKYGHLFVINIDKNQKVLYPGELSQYSTEGEIIIPFGSSLTLKHIGFPQQYKDIKENHIITDLYSNIKDNKIDDNAIIFFLELDNKEISFNKEEIDKYAIFWKNLYQMFFKQ